MVREPVQWRIVISQCSGDAEIFSVQSRIRIYTQKYLFLGGEYSRASTPLYETL